MRYVTPALFAAILCAAVALGSPARAQDAPAGDEREVTLPSSQPAPAAKPPKLASILDRLFAHDQYSRYGMGPMLTTAPAELQSAIDAGALRVDALGRVQVYADTAGDANGAARDLESIGMTVERTAEDLGIVQGRLPVEALDDAAALASVERIRPPEYAIRNTTTEGDAILDADTLRSTYAVNGSGVRIGVISDGLEGLAAAQLAGELPAVNYTSCDAIGTAPMGEPDDPTDPGAGAEGTAMLEIVHDLAPGAELWFGYFGFNVTSGTSLDFRQAVDCLALNTDVVVDDITYLNNGAYDGTSAVSVNASTELNKPANRIRGYYNSVGSVAQQHYQETFVDSGFNVTVGMTTWDIHRFQGTASTTDGGLGRQCTVNPADGFCADRVLLPAGKKLRVGLQWDDTFGASANDYELFLLDENAAALYLISTNEQNGNDNPTEEFAWVNNTGSTQPLAIYIARFGGAPKTFDMFVLCEDCTPIAGNKHNFNTISSSVLNNADADGGVLAMGAINADEPGNDDIAPYSSRGTTNDGRTKPDAVAIDKVTVSGAGGFVSPFVGTSAAAAHAAGIAGLVLSCQPSLKFGEPGDNPAADRTALRNALLNSAVDLGAGGTDNTYGAGRLDADAAAAAAGCAADIDGDLVPQAIDNCPNDANPGQENNDRNFIDLSPPKGYDDVSRAMSDAQGDACDGDDDNDGRLDTDEAAGTACGAFTTPTNSMLEDSDSDRVIDGWECTSGTNPADGGSAPTLASCQAAGDADSDAVFDTRERCYFGTSTTPVTGVNSDGDTLDDSCEIASINADLTVNVIDLQQVQQHTAQGGQGYLLNMDLNRDGTVNVIDLQYAAARSIPCP